MNLPKSETRNLRKRNPHSQCHQSKTQALFLKAFANQNDFISRMRDLMSLVEKRKIYKATEQIKNMNKAFRKYLNERKILHIKIEDVILFQEMCERINYYLANHSRVSTMSSAFQQLRRSLLLVLPAPKAKQSYLYSPAFFEKFQLGPGKILSITFLERSMIKKGFLTLLEKLQTLRKEEYVNETKYLESVLVRECKKLKKYESTLDDEEKQTEIRLRNYNARKMRIVQVLQKEESSNGDYLMIMKNIRQVTQALENAEQRYEVLMK